MRSRTTARRPVAHPRRRDAKRWSSEVEEHLEELARIISQEQGKPISGMVPASRPTWLYFTIADGGAPQLTKVGHYDDRYVREHGRWRFERREAPTDIPIV